MLLRIPKNKSKHVRDELVIQQYDTDFLHIPSNKLAVGWSDMCQIGT